MQSWLIKVSPKQWEALSTKERATIIHLWNLESKLEAGRETLQEVLTISEELISLYHSTKTKPTQIVLDALKRIEAEAKAKLISKAKELIGDSTNPKHIDPRKVKDLMLYHSSSFVDATIQWARQGGLTFEMDGKIRTIDLRFGQ